MTTRLQQATLQQAKMRLSLLVLTPILAVSASAQCPEWTPGFQGGAATGPVNAQLLDESGAVPRLIIGGSFTDVGGVAANAVASYDGQSWSAFGDGPPGGHALSIALHDSGNGSELYAGGFQGLARWDGTTWVSLGFTSGRVEALLSFDDGAGAALFVGGSNLSVAGVGSGELLRFDGAWTDLSSAFVSASNRDVKALTVHDDGTGAALFVGGVFDVTGVANTRNLARWDGTSFSAVSPGALPPAQQQAGVWALHSAKRGTSQVLHVGTSLSFNAPPTESAWLVAGPTDWIRLGAYELITDFTSVPMPGGVDSVWASSEEEITEFFGGLQTPVAVPQSIFPRVDSIQYFPRPSGPTVWAGLLGEGANESHLLEWDGANFSPPAPDGGAPFTIDRLARYDFGNGDEIVAIMANGGSRPLYRFNGDAWTPVGAPAGFSFTGGDVASHEGELFVAGVRDGMGFLYTLARFDGSQWDTYGRYTSFSPASYVVASVDLGSGPELYLGGDFPQIGNEPNTASLARFDGQSLVTVGGSLSYANNQAVVRAITGWDDGQGTALYVAGTIVGVGGVSVTNIARYDGTTWSALPGAPERSGFVFDDFGVIRELETIELPTGRFLIASGPFDLAGGAPSPGLAAWDGTSWTSLTGAPGDPLRLTDARDIEVHDPGGSGDRLYAVAGFMTPTGPVSGIGVWDGTSWSLVPGTDQPSAGITHMLSTDTGEGRALHMGGNFQSVGGVAARNFARFIDPCGDIVGVEYCTAFANSSGVPAICRASGSASLTANDLVLHLGFAPAGEFALFATGTEQNIKPLADGTLCIGGALNRVMPPSMTDANGEMTRAFDFGAFYAVGAMAGQRMSVQAFFRDTNLTGNILGTSDAIEFLLVP